MPKPRQEREGKIVTDGMDPYPKVSMAAQECVDICEHLSLMHIPAS